ncbi:MAG TPA: hypothetical protein PKI32_06805 [Opitutales bacterium]|nr:hypothetical protein [Opitutales bacterium]
MFSTAALVFIPWLTWLAFQCFFISPFPTEASVVLGSWMQAAGLFFIVVHMGRSRKWLMGLFIVAGICAAMFAYVGVAQYSFNPKWVPGGNHPLDWTLGRAMGPYLQPSALAATALLFFPSCYSMASMRSFSIATRIGCVALAMLFACAVMLTADLFACAVLAVVIVFMPLMFAGRWKKRLGLVLAGSAGIALIVLLLGGLNKASREHYRQLTAAADPVSASFAHRQALDAFLERPFFGGGYGSAGVDMWGIVAFADNPDVSDVRSEYLGSLACNGAMSLALWIPMLWLLYKGVRKWTSLPFHKASQEEAFRNLNPNLKPEERAAQLRSHRHSSRNSPTPTTKVLLAGVCVGLASAMAMMVTSSPFQNAAFVFFFMIVSGSIVALTMAGFREISLRFTGVAGLSLSVLWCGLALSISFDSSLARQHVHAAERTASQAEVQGGMSIQKLLRLHYDTIHECDQALMLDPRNVWARMLKARTEFQLATILPSEAERQLAQARSEIAVLISRNARDWRPRAFLADALLHTGAKADEVEAAFADLERIAGDSPMAWTVYARYLMRDRTRSAEAGRAADKALELLPGYAPALEVRSMLSIGSGL